MLFCPVCGNTLLVESGSWSLRFFCQVCPYVHQLHSSFSKKVPLKRKEVDDVLGGEKAWENADSTEVGCSKCGHDKAYFQQIQIRSADEPMSTFYRCANAACAHMWRDG